MKELFLILLLVLLCFKKLSTQSNFNINQNDYLDNKKVSLPLDSLLTYFNLFTSDEYLTDTNLLLLFKNADLDDDDKITVQEGINTFNEIFSKFYLPESLKIPNLFDTKFTNSSKLISKDEFIFYFKKGLIDFTSKLNNLKDTPEEKLLNTKFYSETVKNNINLKKESNTFVNIHWRNVFQGKMYVDQNEVTQYLKKLFLKLSNNDLDLSEKVDIYMKEALNNKYNSTEIEQSEEKIDYNKFFDITIRLMQDTEDLLYVQLEDLIQTNEKEKGLNEVGSLNEQEKVSKLIAINTIYI